MHRFFILLVFLIVINSYESKAQKIKLLQNKMATNIRGLSIVDSNIAWVSGSNAHIGITTNGGKSWFWQQVKGYEQADFRDIEAFSNKEAIIMSSGTPALILKTTDGGITWQLKYQNDDKAYFLDAMDFNDKTHGIILGDPINNKFLMLETTDAGETWHPFSNLPDALAGEAAFAASGTCLKINEKGLIYFVTGGSISRYLELNTLNTNWNVYTLPLTHGLASNGAFSVSSNGLLIAGGNYSKNTKTDSTICYRTSKHGFRVISQNSPGYQSSIEHVKGKTYLSTGTSGTSISLDKGHTWKLIDTNSYNVCSKAKQGNMMLLAGDKGRIGILKL
jgi:photosystem II stability/assembly factor-like uncharacterized protein